MRDVSGALGIREFFGVIPAKAEGREPGPNSPQKSAEIWVPALAAL
jgi:hypothetical protein